MPIYSGMSNIRKAVESTLRQNPADGELVTRDNGSKDAELDFRIAHRTPRALCNRIVAVNEASNAR